VHRVSGLFFRNISLSTDLLHTFKPLCHIFNKHANNISQYVVPVLFFPVYHVFELELAVEAIAFSILSCLPGGISLSFILIYRYKCGHTLTNGCRVWSTQIISQPSMSLKAEQESELYRGTQ
jgi:hypothetical protein